LEKERKMFQIKVTGIPQEKEDYIRNVLAEIIKKRRVFGYINITNYKEEAQAREDCEKLVAAGAEAEVILEQSEQSVKPEAELVDEMKRVMEEIQQQEEVLQQLARNIPQIVQEAVEEIIQNNPEQFRGLAGKDGAPGKDGEPGKDASPFWVGSAIALTLIAFGIAVIGLFTGSGPVDMDEVQTEVKRAANAAVEGFKAQVLVDAKA
jgi:hypothetical protein